MLGLIGGVGFGALAAPLAANAAGRSATMANVAAPAAPASQSALSRPDRVFLERGLMHGAWVRNDPVNHFVPSPELWRQSGFTSPTFYDEAPLWCSSLMDALPGAPWAVAKAPAATNLSSPLPDPNAEWLSPEMQANSDRLFTACFGDEEGYSDAIVDWFTSAYARMHSKYPNVLVHNNQALGEYNDTQMRHYIQTAQPDLISYDFYYWQRAAYYPGGSITSMYNNTGRYRRLALEGLDGNGESPLAFGQYTCGFRLQPPTSPDGTPVRYLRRYFVSESQQMSVSYITWALGGKWLDLFRWEKDESTPPWESDGMFLNYADGSPTPQFFRYVKLNRAMRAFSPYLTRLRTATASVLRGVVGETGAPTAQSNALPDFTPTVDPGCGVTAISTVNIGTANSGKPGDVVIGTFRQLPQLSANEAGGILPDKDAAVAFMIVNALIVANNDYLSPTGTGGNGSDTRQRVSVTVDPGQVSPDVRPGRTRGKGRALSLYRVDRESGHPRRVELTRTVGAYEFTATIDGGEGELYFWG